MAPPRGQCWDRKTNVGSGCTQTHMSPGGARPHPNPKALTLTLTLALALALTLTITQPGVVFPRALNYSSVAGMEVRARVRVRVRVRAQPRPWPYPYPYPYPGARVARRRAVVHAA